MDQSVDISLFERVLRRDQVVTLIALLIVSLAAWAYILSGIGMGMYSMSMDDIAMSMTSEWTAPHFTLMLVMWGTMMLAMMLPSAAPMILLFATIERRRRRHASPFPAVTTFAMSYVIAWMGFSVAATLLQWQLDRLALLLPTTPSANALLAAIILIVVGLYQFTPLKQACLRGCRSPLELIMRYWSRGPFGIGIRHGILCVGCCWMLVLLLFIGGVMNLVWVGLIAAFILGEKIAPRVHWLSYGAGAALISSGIWMLYAGTHT